MMGRAPKAGQVQAGQAITEYALLAMVLAGMVFVFSTDALPFFPAIVELFQVYIDSMHMVVTLPIP